MGVLQMSLKKLFFRKRRIIMPSEIKAALSTYRFDFVCWDSETYYLPESNDIYEQHPSDAAALLSAECHIEIKLKHPRVVKLLCVIETMISKYVRDRHVKTIIREPIKETLLLLDENR